MLTVQRETIVWRFPGDSRANEHLGMVALHTLFLREHNRLAEELHLLNPHWSPDTLYQEARKIMGAIHQVEEELRPAFLPRRAFPAPLTRCPLTFQILTWERYLPRVLGEEAAARLMPPYRGYGPEVDPSIANVFATAAFRFAHVTVRPVVTRLGPGYAAHSQHPPLPLHRSLFASWRIVREGKRRPASLSSRAGRSSRLFPARFLLLCQAASTRCCAVCCSLRPSCRAQVR